jgi:hypothetical protein
LLSLEKALQTEQQALRRAVQAVLSPLAQLCLARGLNIQSVEEQIRLVFVGAARRAHTQTGGTPNASRISTATGLTRREVTRLLNQPVAGEVQRPSPVIQLFTRWLSDAQWCDKHKQPRKLVRQGASDSFDCLAQSVTRDVHPRTLLEELCRLGLASHNTEKDTVQLQTAAFVPRGDWSRMLDFLGQNVGDHLSAATANVLGDGQQHFEQAIHADELSEASMQEIRGLVSQAWNQLLQSMVPRIEALIEADRVAGRLSDQKVRIGLFTWSEQIPSQNPVQPPSKPLSPTEGKTP